MFKVVLTDSEVWVQRTGCLVFQFLISYHSMLEKSKKMYFQYDAIFTKLAVVGALVVRGPRIVVPRMLRDKVVKLAHEGHQGITKTKEYLRTRVWFPGLDKMVEAHIQHCHPCQVVSISQEREPLRMTPLPSEPWKEVAVDFWGPDPYWRVSVGYSVQAV